MLVALYLVAAVLALWRKPRYPAWACCLVIWAAVAATWAPRDAHWGRTVYTPLLAAGTLALGLATAEAYYHHAHSFLFAARVSIGLGLLGVSAGWSVWAYYRRPIDLLDAVLRYALCMRVGCVVWLLLALAFWMSWPSFGWLRWSASLRHVLVVLLMALTFAAGGLLLGRVGNAGWIRADAVIEWVRVGLMATWIGAVPSWRHAAPQSQAAARGGPAAAQSDQ